MRFVIFLFSASCFLGEAAEQGTADTSGDVVKTSQPSAHRPPEILRHDDYNTEDDELEDNIERYGEYDSEFELATRRKLSRYAQNRLKLLHNYFNASSQPPSNNAPRQEGIVCPVPCLPSAFRTFPKNNSQTTFRDD